MRRPYVIGLTGSMGMGKTTTAAMFADEGVPVWDADEAVRRLYAKGGSAVAKIAKLRPEVVIEGAVDRERLKQWIAEDGSAIEKIEQIVHPLLQEDKAKFLANTKADIVLVDLPLLFETGQDANVDTIVVVSVPENVQRSRILARGTMDSAMVEEILKRQMPDREKRARADHVIETHSLEDTRRQVQSVLADIRKEMSNA